MSTSAISVSGLEFSYPSDSGVTFKEFNLSVAQGERFGLLGPNGAGKTTLMNLITGVLKPLGGHIQILDTDISVHPNEAKKKFGFVPQQHSFYPELTPVENLEFFGSWSGLNRQQIKQRSTELLDVLGLALVADKKVSQFSGGMKSRLNLAIGFIHQPQILFLDEPTTGVDVQSRNAIVEYLLELNQKGTTLFYTSHLLSEAERLCTRVALIDDAKIIAYDTVPALLANHNQPTLEALFLKLTGRNYRDA